MRRQKSINLQFSFELLIDDFQTRPHEENRGVRIGDYVLNNAVTSARLRIGQAAIQRRLFRILELVLEIAAFLMTKSFTVGDEKLQITSIRAIHIGVINLVD